MSRAHTVNRITVDVGQRFEEFRRRYEEAAPPLDQARLTSMVQSGATWDAIVADANATGPYGFFIFGKWTRCR